MQVFHPKSDLKIAIKLRDNSEQALPRFEFRYFTTDPEKHVSASYDGEKFINCEPAPEGVMALWDCPNFYPGQLRVLRYFPQSDNRMTDGVFNYITAEKTEIEITDECQNPIEGVPATDSARALRGEAGPKGDIDKLYTDQEVARKMTINYFASNPGQWEQGSFDLLVDGSMKSDNRIIRSKNFIPISSPKITIGRYSDYELLVSYWGSNYEYLGSNSDAATHWQTIYPKTFNTPAGTRYLKYLIRKPNYSSPASVQNSNDKKFMIEAGERASEFTLSYEDKLDFMGDVSNTKATASDGVLYSLFVGGKINPKFL